MRNVFFESVSYVTRRVFSPLISLGAAIISQNVCKFWNDRIISFLLVFYNDIVQYELVLCDEDQFDSVMICVCVYCIRIL
jgi:hypothetical protein